MTTRAYRILGTTDDVTTCDLCGREGLKSTVVLQPLDPDGGDDGEPVYFGCDCGARALDWTQKEVRATAHAADRAKEEAARKRLYAIDFFVSSDRAVIAAREARSRVDMAIPFSVRRTMPEYVELYRAEADARARAEASL